MNDFDAADHLDGDDPVYHAPSAYVEECRVQRAARKRRDRVELPELRFERREDVLLDAARIARADRAHKRS